MTVLYVYKLNFNIKEFNNIVSYKHETENYWDKCGGGIFQPKTSSAEVISLSYLKCSEESFRVFRLIIISKTTQA